jgi:phosphatidylserine decarboxylase
MSDMILDANILPEPLFRLVDTDKVRVRKTDGVITMSPVTEDINAIDELYGSLAGGNLTVDKFLKWTREDKELED